MRISDWALRVGQLGGDDGKFSEALELSSSAEWHSIALEARPFLVASAYLKQARKLLVVTGNYERALVWQAKLTLGGVPSHRILQLPSGTSALFEDASPEHIALSDRLGALNRLTEKEPWIVIASPQSVLERTLPKDVLQESFLRIAVNDTLDVLKIARQLVNLGYEAQEPVRVPGQFSRRGGIFDVFPTGMDFPVRIELMGDEVESLRHFDPNTQRSVKKISHFSISPSRETIYSGESHAADLILQSSEIEAAALSDSAAERLQELIAVDAEALRARTYFDRLDLYRPLIHPDSGCALDLLDEDDAVILDEPIELEMLAARAEEELRQALEARADRGEILRSPATDFAMPAEHLASHSRTITMTAMNSIPEWAAFGSKHDIQAISLEPYRNRGSALAATLKNYKDQGFTLVVSTDQPNRASAVLAQAELFATSDTTEENPAGPFLANGNLGGGFVLLKQRLAVITDAELFGVARLKLPQRKFSEGSPVATVLDLRPGDYVVHINFGIGIFRGLTKKTIEGIEREYLLVEYQAPDKLFVPADQLDRIQKYLNPGDTMPKLNRLSGGEWQRTLGKAKEEAKAFARDLVQLYAQRTRVARKGYGPDTPFQREMEDTFPWSETQSQLLAIKDAKRDMEQPYPMDRLVCGDVGFGKTEVAIRAAFKAVQAARQVAVLCPTTILSEQHFKNFSERLESFGTRLRLINRFTPPAEKKATIADLKNGEADLVVGTHSLLGVGIEFKDLGMVVIDEEQKFGVKQKEMLKKLRTEVDVLTLSATPIPRTLSMALMDIRQMSLINDPPPGRLPIRTFVRSYASEVVREAILREMARGGQIFYVYNRVESISHVAEKIRKLVPTARVGIGHGQMTDQELEPIMIGFIKGEIDILLSTTIIENGIDISNANTLIVEQADRLGLSQLYQLRGRVGRSDRQAYAYFFYSGTMDATIAAPTVRESNMQATGGKKHRPTMSENALARLQALQEFSTLGSGYSLAFRDLQIRGAGELLGAKQSGTMVTVGYELYSQLINEAVSTLKNSVDQRTPSGDSEPRDPLASLEPLPAFDVPASALLPDTYIKDQSQRLYYYQQMMSSRTEERLGQVQAEVEDRYGIPVPEAKNAFEIMALRIRAQNLGIDKIDAKQGRVSATFKDRSEISPRVFSIMGQKNRECYVTREALIWPYRGEPISAISRLFQLFEGAVKEVERDRASFA
jgi:transcription-repair coupling factor (superfamily II helicase)